MREGPLERATSRQGGSLNKISNSLRALESFERFSDEELNIITDFLDVQDLVDMAHGFSPSKAVGLMLRHPILAMKVAHQLMGS